MIVGYNDDGTIQNRMLFRVFQICRQENVTLNKENCHLRCSSITFFGEITSKDEYNLIHEKCMLTDMSMPKSKKELQSFLSIMQYLSEFSPAMSEIYLPPCRLALGKTEWTMQKTYQDLYEKENHLLKKMYA